MGCQNDITKRMGKLSELFLLYAPATVERLKQNRAKAQIAVKGEPGNSHAKFRHRWIPQGFNSCSWDNANSPSQSMPSRLGRVATDIPSLGKTAWLLSHRNKNASEMSLLGTVPPQFREGYFLPNLSIKKCWLSRHWMKSPGENGLHWASYFLICCEGHNNGFFPVVFQMQEWVIQAGYNGSRLQSTSLRLKLRSWFSLCENFAVFLGRWLFVNLCDIDLESKQFVQHSA